METLYVRLGVPRDVDPEDQQRFLSTIALEAERLGRLANDLPQGAYGIDAKQYYL